MEGICTVIGKLIGYAEERLGLSPRDAVYARNTLLDLLGLDAYTEGQPYAGESVGELLSSLRREGRKADLFSEEQAGHVCDQVMGALEFSPARVEEEFARRRAYSPQKAMEWLYRYSIDSDYVKKEVLDKNPRFEAENGLIVTINLAKPEFRDPKKAQSGNSTKSGYPKCTICRENEGYSGRDKRTLRTVSLVLGGEDWFWQFSPYGYFEQHGIAVNEKHVPMHVDKGTFYKLMEFADCFPQYFIGCNAPLERIGGSVLAHDHFQGGGEQLPLHRAPVCIPLRHASFPGCSAGVVRWPGTVVRVEGSDMDEVAELCEHIRASWCAYRDEARGIIPEDEKGVHSAVSPTARRTPQGYVVDLILRSNVTSEAFPDGVFHAHPEYHVIKKESIGLIEAQGLFILPGRLQAQLQQIKEALIADMPLPKSLNEFSMIWRELRAMAPSFTASSAEEAVRRELASVCFRILGNTAVFKEAEETAEFLTERGFSHV